MRVRRWVAFVATCLVMSLFLVLDPVRLHQAQAAGAEEQLLLELINGYRQENGVGPLVPSGVLSTSATRHSEDMAAHGFFSHSTGESSYYPSGSSPADRTTREGYPANGYTAENIARGQQTAEEVFEDWRSSPEHNTTMLGEQYTAAGIGHVGSYWTADFGSVADASLDLGTLQPYGERPEEQTTGERASTRPSAAEQTPGARGGDEQPNTDERTPDERALLEGTQPEARGMNVENEPAADELENLGQTSTLHQTTVGQTPDGETPPRGETPEVEMSTRGEVPDRELSEEAPSGAAYSPQLPSESIDAEQYAAEPPLVDTLSPSSEELGIGGLQAAAEEGLHRVSPVETEAMESALAAREDVPGDLVWQAPSVPVQPVGESVAEHPPEVSGPGSSGGGDVASITPLATRKLPETTASPLKLFLGCFLLLCGFLVFEVTRKRRES
jgi:hypothetical protein